MPGSSPPIRPRIGASQLAGALGRPGRAVLARPGPAVEADRAREAVPGRRREPRVAAAEAEADGEDRRSSRRRGARRPRRPCRPGRRRASSAGRAAATRSRRRASRRRRCGRSSRSRPRCGRARRSAGPAPRRSGTARGCPAGSRSPSPPGSSGVAAKAARRFPSRASRTRSSCETAAPEITGIGGRESLSKHTAIGAYRAVPCSDEDPDRLQLRARRRVADTGGGAGGAARRGAGTGRGGALDERARSLLVDLHRPLRQPLPPARAAGRSLDRQLRRARRGRPGAGADAGPGRPAAPDRGPARPPPALAPAEPLRRVRPALRHGLGALRRDRAAAPSACSRSRAGSTRTSSTASPASRPRRPSRSSSGEAGSAATWRTSASPSAARSASPPATRAATCPTSGSRARSRRWTSTPGSRSGWASAGGRSTAATTCPGSAGCAIGRGRDAADVAMITTYGDATLTEMAVWADESAEAVLPDGR